MEKERFPADYLSAAVSLHDSMCQKIFGLHVGDQHLFSIFQHMIAVERQGILQRLPLPSPSVPELRQQMSREEVQVQKDEEIPIACSLFTEKRASH